MPIKLPKTFARRKSSGNALDEIQQSGNRDSVSSFKVLARPNSTGRSLDAVSTARYYENQNPPQGQYQQEPQPKSSFELDNEDLFSTTRGDTPNRGSGGTSNSLSTAPYDSAASSTRLSTTSTNPSSVDTGSGSGSGSGRNVRKQGHPMPQDIPVPPPHSSKPGFLKQAGRTFSFGLQRGHSKDLDHPPVPPIPTDRSRRDTITNARERAMTTSSITNAAPPRLDDTSLSMDNDGDDFGDMFAGLNKKPSRENLTSMKPAPLKASSQAQSASRAAPPQPITVNSAAPIEDSPYSWTSQNSRDGLINSPSPSRTITQPNTQPSNLRNMHMNSIPSEAPYEDNLFAGMPLRREPEMLASIPSSPARGPPSSFPTSNGLRSRAQSTATSRSVRQDTSEYDLPAFDPALLANAQLATRYEEKQTSPIMQAQNNKIMTPAEFEKYKAHKDETRRYNKVFGKAASDDGSGDDYDDDEEDDKAREAQAIKQRKKQEAHLAVYRQQMMKVTGDSPAAEPVRSGSSMGGLGLADTQRRMSSMTLNQYSVPPNRSPEFAAEEEDEDVPLGILAAHGFPNKNRPPQRLVSSSSNPSLRNLAAAHGGGSVVGEGSRGPLPAFARHLPADPYFGAGLVHQSERAPMQMHASSSQTHLAVQPQSSGAATQHPLHPAGLVGVIAGEERARAMRRGSPNAAAGGNFEMPIGMPRTSPQIPQGPYQHQPQMPYMMSPAEQAQMQMSQSMTQMMQMQMQWMQQMQQMGMMGQMPMPPMPSMPGQIPQMNHLPNNIPGMPQMSHMYAGQPNPMVRPQSTPLQQYGQSNQRTMSTLTPSMAGWTHSAPMIPVLGQGSQYAHSIAPSERSNVGLASRYRPVSTVTQEPDSRFSKRASTFTSTTFRPWTNENQTTSKLATSTVRAVQHAADDEDDEQGWADMKARREKKKSSWRLRRGTKDNALQELYNAPA